MPNPEKEPLVGKTGTHADILNIALAGKEMRELHIECLSYEIIIGLLGLTLAK
jgi:hypothetical protein